MRAVIYTRISQDATGEQAGVERQYEDCRKHIDQRGWTLIREFRDNDVSASGKVHRPQYEAMLDGAKRGDFDVVVCYHFDRLLRKPRQMEDWLDLVSEGTCRITSTTMELDLTSDVGPLIARILAWLFEFEIKQASRRKKRELDQRALDGVPHGARSFGYQNVEKVDSPDGARTFAHDPVEAPMARRIYDWYLDGISQRQIAHRLNESGYTTARGNAWTQSGVRTFLLNPRNAGLLKHDGKVIGSGNWEPLIDQDSFEKTVERIGHWHYGPKPGGTPKYLLVGLIECGRCGQRMGSGKLSKNHPSKNKRRYNCRHCNRLSRVAEPVEKLVDAFIRKIITNPEEYLATEIPGNSGNILDSLKKGDQIKQKIGKLNELLLKGKIDEFTYEERYDTLQQELKQLSDLVRASDEGITVWTMLGGPLSPFYPTTEERIEHWEALSPAEQREVISSLLNIRIEPASTGPRFHHESVKIWVKPEHQVDSIVKMNQRRAARGLSPIQTDKVPTRTLSGRYEDAYSSSQA